MPTELSPDDRNFILRLTCGAGGLFAVGLVLGWPMAVVGAVFSALFLQGPAAPPVKAALSLAFLSLWTMSLSFVLSSALAPYPVVFLAAIAIGIFLSYAWSLAGAGMLHGILTLMAVLMVPNLVLQSPDLTLVLVTWVPLNLLIAAFTAMLMFELFPAAPPQPGAAAAAPQASEFDRKRRMLRMSLVTVPFALTFFVIDSSYILTLFFVAILGQQLAAMPAAGPKVAKTMLLANAMGAAFAIVSNELTVMAPVLITAMVLGVLVCLTLGSMMKSGKPSAALAGSALSTFLIIYGGTIAPFADDADTKAIDRILQVGAACLFVILAYLVIDEFLPERQKSEKPAETA
ncbi:MAG: DUF2955 domain-containing protein [Rhodobacteraceae bacterium]|nr:DUF2955 domain-containing protein [Paracoccaceae bacterium]